MIPVSSIALTVKSKRLQSLKTSVIKLTDYESCLVLSFEVFEFECLLSAGVGRTIRPCTLQTTFENENCLIQQPGLMIN